MKLLYLVAAVAALTVPFAQPAAARDHMWIVSSATSLPFTKAVAERAAKRTGAPSPAVDHADTTVGFTYLCAGPGPDQPDAVSATRRLRKVELDACQKNGVGEIVEIPIGLDILVVAQSKDGPPLRPTLAQMFLAFARQITDEYGEQNANPHRKWREIDSGLPDIRIDIRVLPRFSGSRETFEDLFLGRGALNIPEVARQYPKGRILPRAVRAVREDHPFVIVHESEQAIARALIANPTALGVFSYRFLQISKGALKALPIEGAEPTPENAYAGKYAGTRTLYLYIRKAQLGAVRGLDGLASEYVSEAALGQNGYLLAMGFVPLAIDDMMNTMVLAGSLPPVSRDKLPD